MAQLGNTGINGNLMVVGKIVATTILSDAIQTKVINGGGGNSMISQNSSTSGSEITLGSTDCPLKIQAKNQINFTKNIAYAGSSATHQMIKFIDGNQDGQGIVIGGGALAIFGSRRKCFYDTNRTQLVWNY